MGERKIKGEPKTRIGKWIRRKYKSYILVVGGLICGTCDNDICVTRMPDELPSILLTFIIFSMVVFIIIPLAILEFIVMKILGDRYKRPEKLMKRVDKLFTSFFNRFQETFPLWVDNKNPNYEEEFVYFKYAAKAYKFFQDNRPEETLQELIDLRDTARENNLIVRLSGLPE